MWAHAAILAFGWVMVCVGQGWAWMVPATGITKCYDTTGEIACPSPGQAYYGQNGNYRGQAHTFADDGTVVTDQATGLAWQKTPDGLSRNWDNAVAYCEALELGGQSDWRLPFQRELVTILDHAAFKPALPAVFAGASGQYWSKTPYQGYAGAAWYVSFAYGVSEFNATAESRPVRCVRGQPLADSVFVAQANRVDDVTTGLTWEKTPSPSGKTWEEALAYCEGQTTDGYTDWRLPNVMELRTLVDYARIFPAIDTTKFVESGVSYWTGSTCAGIPGVAWGVNFASGISANGDKPDNDAYARCVRGGLSPRVSLAPLYNLLLQ